LFVDVFRGTELVEFFLALLLDLGEPKGEFCWDVCKANSFLRVWGVRPAAPTTDAGLAADVFFGPFDRPGGPLAVTADADDEQLLRMAARDGDKLVGDEVMFRGFEAIIYAVTFY
jgi:hypothetical protein